MKCWPGADTGLNLTGAITENGHRALGTSGWVSGGRSRPQKPKGFQRSEMYSQPLVALKIINFIDLLFKDFHFMSSIS